MGELKRLREQEEKYARYKKFKYQIFHAALGLVTKTEDRANDQLEKFIVAGEELLGDSATDANKYLVAARGVYATVQDDFDDYPEKIKMQTEKLQHLPEELFNKYVDAGSANLNDAEELNKFVLASIGAFTTARVEGTRIFEELIETGELRVA